MRIRTSLAISLALIAFTTQHASLAAGRLPKLELINDLNKLGTSAFCRFDFTFGSDSCPESFTPLGTEAAFIAVEPINGFALWRTDGTRSGTTVIRDVNTIRIFDPIVAGNGVLFFQALDRTGQYGRELWRSDGTFNGTGMIADINPGPADSNPQSMVNAGGMVYFTANDGALGFELWKIEAGRSIPGTGLLPRPQLVKDIFPGPGHGGPTSLAFAGSSLFFTAQDADHGYELWKSDGTADGTVLVKDIVPGPAWSFPSPIVPFGDRVLFFVDLFGDEAHGGLWISDGTEAGTQRLGFMAIKGEFLVVAGDRAFFTTSDEETGFELGVTDGTVAGTRTIDARPGPDGVSPSSIWFAPLGNKLVFQSQDEDLEPWISDGTVEGTHLLKDIEPGFLSSGPRQFVAVGDVVFFSAMDTAHGEELWVTDGTTEGTRLVKDIYHGPESGFPRSLRNVGGVLYLSVDDGVHGFEPWKVTP